MSHSNSPELLRPRTLVYYQKVARKTNNFLGIGKPKMTAFIGSINFFKKNPRPVYYHKIQTNASMTDVCPLCEEHGHHGGTDPMVDPAWLSGSVSWVGGC